MKLHSPELHKHGRKCWVTGPSSCVLMHRCWSQRTHVEPFGITHSISLVLRDWLSIKQTHDSVDVRPSRNRRIKTHATCFSPRLNIRKILRSRCITYKFYISNTGCRKRSWKSVKRL